MKINYGYEVWDFGEIEAFGVSLRVGGRDCGVHDKSYNKIPSNGLSSKKANAEDILRRDKIETAGAM
jgi:hypothetical protein